MVAGRQEDKDSVPTQSFNDKETTNKQTGRATHTLKQRRPNRTNQRDQFI